MKSLTHIGVHGVKTLHAVDLAVPPLIILAGPNGVGKTSFFQSVRLGVLGYEPSIGKTLAASRQLASADEMHVAMSFDDGFGLRRTFGDSLDTEVLPPNGERTEKERQARIDEETGRFVPSFDLGSFLELSAEKRRAYLLGLLPRSGSSLTKERFEHWLGYEEAETPTQEAIQKLWLEKVMGSESPIDGLASAIEHVRGKVNEREADRQAQVKVAEAAAADALRLSEGEAEELREAEDLPALQAKLGELEQKIGDIRGRAEAADRASRRRRERDERLVQLASQVEEIGSKVERLRGELGSLPEPGAATGDRIRTAQKRLEEVTAAASEAQAALSTASERLAGHRREVDRVRAALADLEGLEECPVCGSTADLARARDARAAELTSAEQLAAEAQAAQAEAYRISTEAREQREQVREAVRQLETNAETARVAAAKRAQIQGEITSLEARREGHKQLQAQLAAEEIADVQAVDTSDLEDLQRSAGEIRVRIRTEQERIEARARRAGAADAERQRADRAQEELDLRTRRVEALKRIYSSLQRLRADVIKELVGPVESTADEILQVIDPRKRFSFVFEREGKDTFDFGFEEDGVFRGFDSASTGEDAFLAVVFVAALIAAVQPAWPVLLIDNVEQVDDARRSELLRALASISDRFGNIIVAGCCSFEEHPGWTLLDVRELTQPALAGAA